MAKLGPLVVAALIFVASALGEEAVVRLFEAGWQRLQANREAKETGDHHKPDYVEPPAPEPSEPVPTVQPPSPPPPPPVIPWDLTPGKEFDIFVLSQEYRWELGTNRVMRPDGILADMGQNFDLLLEQHGRRYKDLIAVGTASCEGEEGVEIDRAEGRAEQMILWLREALDRIGDREERHLYRLNLGRYRSCAGSLFSSTERQRRIILIAIKERRPDMGLTALGQALRAELDDPGRLPLGFATVEYLRFLLNEAR